MHRAFAYLCQGDNPQSFGGFVEFQEVASLQTDNEVSPNFCGSRLPSAVFQTPLRHIPPSPAAWLRRRTAVRGRLGAEGYEARSWRRSDPDKVNFQPNTDFDLDRKSTR